MQEETSHKRASPVRPLCLIRLDHQAQSTVMRSTMRASISWSTWAPVNARGNAAHRTVTSAFVGGCTSGRFAEPQPQSHFRQREDRSGQLTIIDKHAWTSHGDVWGTACGVSSAVRMTTCGGRARSHVASVRCGRPAVATPTVESVVCSAVCRAHIQVHCAPLSSSLFETAFVYLLYIIRDV